MIKDEVLEGLKVLASYNLPFDVVAEYPDHLHHIPKIAEELPDLKMVIDHLAKQPIKEGIFRPWAGELAKVSAYPRVFAKISGLNTAAAPDWTAEDIKEYIDFAVQKFGSDRIMFGSDWPIANLAGDYQRVHQETLKIINQYSDQDRDDILGGTAAEFYRLFERGVD